MSLTIKHLIFWILLISWACSSAPKVDKKKSPKKKRGTQYNLGPTKPQKNHFIESSEKYGLGAISSIHNYVIDLNNDGFSDLVILPKYYSIPKFFYFNPKKKKFELDEKNYPLVRKRASFLVFEDFNKDGVTDLALGVLNQRSALLKEPLRFYQGKIINHKIVFTELPQKKEILGPSSTALFLDFDLDGQLDLFAANWFSFHENKSRPVADELYKGSKGFFKNVSGVLQGEHLRDEGSYLNAAPTFGASLCDIDQNGEVDILATSSNFYANKLWLNNLVSGRRQSLIDYGRESGFSMDREGIHSRLGGGNTQFALCADYNNDGIMDIFVGEASNEHDLPIIDRSSLLTGKNLKGLPGFIRTPYTFSAHDSKNRVDKRGVWVDLNFDGLLDLMIDNSNHPPSSRLVVLKQNPDHSFEETSIQWGVDHLNPSGTVILDVNQDGRPDILSGQSTTRLRGQEGHLRLYENNIKRQQRKNLSFTLLGEKSNRRGIGALALFKTNKRMMRQMVQYSYGALPSQNEEGILFNLEKGERAQWIEIHWPLKGKNNTGGQSKRYFLKGLKFDQFIKIDLKEDGTFQIVKKQ